MTFRRADEQVGRELLVGSAALLPLSVLLHGASLLPGRPIGEVWSFVALYGHEEAGLRLFILLDLLQNSVFLAGVGLLLAVPLLGVVKRPSVALPLALAGVALAFLGASPAEPAGGVAAAGLLALLVGVVYAGGLVAMTTLLGTAALGLTSLPAGAGSWLFFGAASGPAVAALVAVLGWWLAVHHARRSSGESKTVNMAAIVGSR